MFTEEQILTPEIRGQRTLAAIVFTDVVGYSALMAATEEHTLDLLRRDFLVMKQLCHQFEGKVLKTIGDALLMYFASAVKAVACAQEIQSQLAAIATNLAEDDILRHRIGIHLGDVFFNGSDVMGDGVNVAARLQAEAKPGGICLSQTVYEVVKNPLSLKANDLEQRTLKNIPGAMSVYQIPPIYPTPFATQWELEQAQADQEMNSNESVIYSSGQWVLLGDRFFKTETYSHNFEGKITIQILSNNSQDDTVIQSLRSHIQQPSLLNFAYQNDGFLVKVKSVEAASRGNFQIWTIALQPEYIKNQNKTLEQSYKGRKQFYSADDIAVLKVKRLLLNDPPKLLMLTDSQMFSPALAEREMLENLIKSSSTTIIVEDCVIQSLYPIYKDTPKVFLELARLQAIFFLQAAGIIEQVMELSLGPISQGQVHVRFQGKRQHIYTDIKPAIVEIEGDCPLVIK